ncbi:MAG: DUF3943 domain-containing protein [Kofleriaceae bacterium]
MALEPNPADLDLAYHRLLARRDPRYLLPAVENVAMLSLGAVRYFRDQARLDNLDFDGLGPRFSLDAWRYDNNGFPINFIWHPVDGAQYHVFARASDLSLPMSVLYAGVSSMIWEAGIEFQERLSINDALVTTGAGTSLGEFVHWLGRYLESAPEPRPWHAVARWGLTTTRAAHNAALGHDRLRPHTTADALGLSSDIWHRFEFFAGVGLGRLEGDAGAAAGSGPRPELATLGTVRAHGELAALPGYLTAPVLDRSFVEANLTSARLRVLGGDDAIGLDLATDAVLIGHHHQRLPLDRAGHATTIGVALGFHYRRDLIGAWTDRVAQLHLPGLALDHHVHVGEVTARARLRAHIDFAGMHAAGYGRWRAANPDGVDKAILRKRGYYFGWGPSASLELEVGRPGYAIGGALGYARYDSDEGLDRTQEDVTVDVTAGDRLWTWDAWLRVGAPSGRAFLEARLEEVDRAGAVGDVDARDRLRTFSLSVGTTR